MSEDPSLSFAAEAACKLCKEYHIIYIYICIYIYTYTCIYDIPDDSCILDIKLYLTLSIEIDFIIYGV